MTSMPDLLGSLALAPMAVSADRSVRSLALDIQLGQEEQNRQMAAWLRRWNAPDGAEPDAMHAGMMGMATPAEIQANDRVIEAYLGADHALA